MKAVVNTNGRMENSVNCGNSANRESDPGKIPEQFNVIQESRTEPLGSGRIIGANVVDENF
jgi:hypothetical protein